MLLSFTENDDFDARKNAALSALNSITVGGGGDLPETAFDGLTVALDGTMGEWRVGAGVHRVVLFTDAEAKDGDRRAAVEALAANIGAVITRERSEVGGRGRADTYEFAFEAPRDRDPVSEGDPTPPYIPADDPITLDPTPATLEIYTILTSGGFAVDSSDLEAVAEATGGAFSTADTNADLVEQLRDIIELPPTIPSGAIIGTDGDDKLKGKKKSGRVIEALDGEDTVKGRGEDDTIRGGEGDDKLRGQGGKDQIEGGGGLDTLRGDGGKDLLDGGEDSDALRGDGGKDTLLGGTGQDTLDGGRGSDSLLGGDGSDSMLGGSGNDTLEGEDGFDTMSGGGGNDSLVGGLNSDEMSGGGGKDTLLGDGGFDTLEGGGGNDLLSGGADRDTLDGGRGNDLLGGGEDDDLLLGGSGRDTLEGGELDDTLEGGKGADVFVFTMTYDGLYTGDGSDVITDFQSGKDLLSFVVSTGGASSPPAAPTPVVTEVSGEVVIEYGDDVSSVRLAGVSLSEFSSDDIEVL